MGTACKFVGSRTTTFGILGDKAAEGDGVMERAITFWSLDDIEQVRMLQVMTSS